MMGVESAIASRPLNGAQLEAAPLMALSNTDRNAALAVVCGVDGPSYRPLGACMAVLGDGSTIGNLSSGCIEADIARHALKVIERGVPATLRYGRGSPFMDIVLPCGGGLDILIVPNPDRDVLKDLLARQERRQPCSLRVETQTGKIAVAADMQTGPSGTDFFIRITPRLRFLVFGAGPEAVVFGSIVHSMGFENTVFSPDQRTLDAVRKAGCAAVLLTEKRLPPNAPLDARTAATLFFHDHDWEPPLLAPLLASPAFFVGAQGSQRAAAARLHSLKAAGVSTAHRARLRGPIGLIRSTRDAYSLAISVLAEIVSAEQTLNA